MRLFTHVDGHERVDPLPGAVRLPTPLALPN